MGMFEELNSHIENVRNVTKELQKIVLERKY
jgi:hypothetical protein